MIALIQRVTSASVTVEGECIASIEAGLLALIGVEKHDQENHADKLLDKLLAYRVFADEQGKMNLNLQQADGGLLLVPQFTLVADTGKGNRPGFSNGATPEQGKKLFTYLCEQAGERYASIQQGQFGADMKVALVNDGPVTFWLQTKAD